MADFSSDGQTRVFYVSAIASQVAPTVAELNAGLSLQSIITADGLEGFEASTSDVDNTALNSTFDTVTIGRDKYTGTMLRLKKQLTGDTAFATLVRGTTGFIVVRRDVPETTAWTVAQKCEVYPIICGQTRRLKPEGNTLTRWEVDTKIVNAPSLTATVS